MVNELKTARFWITVLLSVIAGALAALDVISGEAWLGLAIAILGGYGFVATAAHRKE